MIGAVDETPSYSGADPISSAIRSCKSAFISTGVMSCVINLLTLTAPIFMLQVADRVLSSQSIPTLIVIGVLALGLYLFFGFLDYLRTRVVGRIGLSIDARLSGLIFEICTLLPIKMGEKAQNMNPMRDLEVVRQFLSGPGPSAIFDVPWMPFYLLIVTLFHPLLGLMAAAGAVCIIVLIAINEVMSARPMSELGVKINDRARFLEDCRQCAEAVQSMGMLQSLRHKWLRENSDYLIKQRRTHDVANLFSSIIKVFRFVMQSGILGGGAWLVIRGEVTPGVMIAAAIIASRALAPVEQAVAYWRGFVSARQSIRRLRSNVGRWRAPEVKTELPLPSEELSLQDLSTAPAEHTTPYVRNVCLRLAAGEGLGIIGQSGSGKTTLVRSILGINRVMAGHVRFDGADLSQWSQDVIGRFIGYLPQEVQLLNGTVAENIARFDPVASSEDIITAARLAGIHDMIVSMDDGYDTVIGEGGYLISGGQRQRIGLARAIFGAPFIVILDEPNSNLDAEGETALTAVIQHLKDQGSIVVVIAHRVSAISAVDRVLVLEAGQVKALGPKNAILNKILSPVAAKAG